MAVSRSAWYCHGCGHAFGPTSPVKDGVFKCPECGSVTVDHKGEIHTEARLEETLGLTATTKAGEVIRHSETHRRGLASSGWLEGGEASYVLEGRAPQHEADTLGTCNILIEALRKSGEDWDWPTRGDTGADAGVDCVAMSRGGGERRLLRVQVVRASPGQEVWRTLNRLGRWEKAGVPPADLADELRRGVEHKARQSKIPANERQNLCLALDATRLPAHALTAVVNRFRKHHGEWCHSLGFQSVWLVGPGPDMTWRLDMET